MDASITTTPTGYPLHRKSCECPVQDVGPYQSSCLVCHTRGWFWDDACECVECCDIAIAADIKHTEAA